MPKYWGKQIFTHRRFPEVGEKQKAEKKVGEQWPALLPSANMGGANKPPGPTLAEDNLVHYDLPDMVQ